MEKRKEKCVVKCYEKQREKSDAVVFQSTKTDSELLMKLIRNSFKVKMHLQTTKLRSNSRTTYQLTTCRKECMQIHMQLNSELIRMDSYTRPFKVISLVT